MTQIKIESRQTIKKVEKAIASLFDYELQKVTNKDVYFFLNGISDGWSENTTVKILCSRGSDATWLDIGVGSEQVRAEYILSQIKNEVEKNV